MEFLEIKLQLSKNLTAQFNKNDDFGLLIFNYNLNFNFLLFSF